MPRPPTDEQFTELVHASWASLYPTAYLMLGDHADSTRMAYSESGLGSSA
ncbi:MAG: hypothetical protein JWO11_3852 [Nocardioides sp.]|nr:hypothetical protein [Nocardioides sp.]